MIRRGGGSIINIASTAGMRGLEYIGASAHCAGKGGVIAMTRQLALEGAPHWIRANSIAPGPIRTPATSSRLATDSAWRDVFGGRSEEHTSELQSLMRISYAVFCLKKKRHNRKKIITQA